MVSLCLFAMPHATAAPIQTDNLYALDKEHVRYFVAEQGLRHGGHVGAQESLKTVKCESSFHVTALGDGGLAYGPAQFHEASFYRMLEAAIADGEPFFGFSYKNPADQIQLMAWALDNGYGEEWTCWKPFLG